MTKYKVFYEPAGNRTVSFEEAFYMGTKQGGALFGKTGSLEPGYAFDALVIGGIADRFYKLSPVQLLERFCYLGETKHIRARYLGGRKV
jgi:guanine deaminase